MRICITRSQRFLYSETFIQNQIKGLSELVPVFTLHTGRVPEREEDGKRIHRFPFFLMHKLTRALTGKRSNFFSNYGLKRYLKAHDIELVLANYGLSAAHLVPVCRDLNLPLVPHFHGYDATQRKVLDSYAKLYADMFAYVPAIIAVSNVMKTQLAAIGAPADKIHVIPYGINMEQFQPKPGLKANYPLFLAVGRFTPKKAPLVTIRAFSKVLQQYPGAKLIMIGGKEGEYQNCLRLVESLGITESVEFPGILPPEEVAVYMQKAHVFVQHSITAPNGDMEGTPNSILEAGASGLPVVSTRHGGILDAVIHGETGYLVDEHDEAGMASYMIKMLEDPSALAAMGIAARKHIARNYDSVGQIQKLLALLQTTVLQFGQQPKT